MSSRSPTWLGWLALMILLVGGMIAYMYFIQEGNPDAHANMIRALAMTFLGAGICVICLTADWWMRH